MEIVCRKCGHSQERISLGRKVSYKVIDELSYYKSANVNEWTLVPEDICEECSSLEIGVPVSNMKNISGWESGRRDPSSAMYWKKGKSDEEISKVIAGETNPY